MWILIFFLFLIFFLAFRNKVQPKSYGIKSTTSLGVDVRSKTEKRIAEYFTRNNIEYVYEKTLRSKGWFNSKKISNPDFYLPEYDVYVEYWGLVDAPDKKVKNRYVREMKWKMKQYYENDVKFVSIYPSNLRNLDWIFRKKFEKATGYQLPS